MSFEDWWDKYGMQHSKYFKKEKNYDDLILFIREKIKKTLEISHTSNKNEDLYSSLHKGLNS